VKPSEALRLARVTLQNGGFFIRHALLALGTPGADKAAAHIRELIFPYRTYGIWLWYHDRAWYEKYVRTPGAHIEARLLWIDDMLEYWESKGE